MKILFLSDNFPPEVNAPASRTFEHCRAWVRLGHEVTVVTGFPNFPRGQVYPGYAQSLWRWETMEGVRVLRVWTYVTANEGFVKRTLDYLSYMAAAVLAAPFCGPADVVVGTSPQFFTACAAWAASCLKSAPFVFELRDLWPDSIVTVGAMKEGFALRQVRRVESFLYRRAALIVSVTHSFVEELARRGVSRSKMVVVTNGVDGARFKPQPRDEALAASLGLSGMFVAGYIGTLGLAHGLDSLLEMARLLKAQPSFRLLFLGDGARKAHLKARAAEMGLANVVFVDSVPKEQVARYWSLLDVAVIHLKRDPLFETVIPSKLFECMGMGVPVVLGVKGESARLVAENGMGVAVEPEDGAALAQAATALYKDPALRRRLREKALAAAPKYSRDELAAIMLRALDSSRKLVK